MACKGDYLVAFSYDIFVAQRAGGISRCMIELMRSIAAYGSGAFLWAGFHSNDMVSEVLSEGWASSMIFAKPGGWSGRVAGSCANEFRFSAWANLAAPKIVHRTYYPLLDLAGRQRVRVETLHDMWDEVGDHSQDKGAVFRSFLKKRACDRADAVICVSEHTKQQALDIWPHLEGRLHVIPHGVRRLSSAPVRRGEGRPYFLFVGKRGVYKNFARIISAFGRAGLDDFDIVCFGGGAFSNQERSDLRDLGLEGRVSQITGSDHLLAELYENATALIYPSSYEGFGLPILEAMIHGSPVIAAPLTSLPEVGGDCVFYADPFDEGAWVDALRQLALNEGLRQTLRSKGFDRASEYSWNHSAASHIALYRALS